MNLYTLLTIGITLYLCRGLLYRLKQKWFASFMTRVADLIATALQEHKMKLFASLPEVVSADPQLKDKKQIRILEIGCGSGANLKYFPSGSRLLLVDINPSFECALRENLLKYPELQLEKLVHCSAETMTEIPDESVDVLVSTTVLCSVPDVQKTLDEVLRVLVPGGKFYFLEHVLDNGGTWRPILQKFLTQLRIWPSIFCGCCLTREIGSDVQGAGFKSVKLEYFTVDPQIHFVLHLIKSQIWGVAIK